MIHIAIAPCVEPFDEFGWENYPLLLHHSIPIPSTASLTQSTPLSMLGVRSYGTVLSFGKDHSSSVPVRITKPATRTSSTTTTALLSKSVHFDCVKVREHSLTVGDHDWCEGRLPLCLDWKHTPEISYNLDWYEHERMLQGRTPRGRLPRLNYYQRKSRLRCVAGLSERDMERFERGRVRYPILGSIRKSQTIAMFSKIVEKHHSQEDDE
jgi:hypothetical protein